MRVLHGRRCRQRVIQPKVRSTTPAPRQNLEARISVDPSHDLYDELFERRLVYEFSTAVGTVGEEMLDPRPAVADSTENILRPRSRKYPQSSRFEHERPSVRIHHNLALAPCDFLPASEPRTCVAGALTVGCRWRQPPLEIK